MQTHFSATTTITASVYLTKTGGHTPSSATARFHLVVQCMNGTTIHAENTPTEPAAGICLFGARTTAER